MESSVEHWLGRLEVDTGKIYGRIFDRWLEWIPGDSPLAGLGADGVLAFQREYRDFQVLDLVQGFAQVTGGTEGYKRYVYSALRSFFLHNRAMLPRDPSFSVRGSRPRNVGNLVVSEVRRILDSSNECYRAIFLCMLMSGMGRNELIFWNKEGYESLKEQLDHDLRIIKIDLPGRKKGKNKRPFYTFIGRDAIDALRVWLRIRPKDATTIFTNQYGDSVSHDSVGRYWWRHLYYLGLIKRQENYDHGFRHGKNLHEIRDVFRSRWQKSGRAPEAAEFFMGHVIDPNDYNQAFRDEAYAVSMDPDHIHVDEVDEMFTDRDKKIADMEEQLRLVQEYIRRKG